MRIEPHHVGLTVSDLDRAQAWYSAAFGFEPQLEFIIPDGTRIAVLQSDAGARIELFGVPNAHEGLHHVDPPDAMLNAGFGHIAFGTDNVQAAFDAAVAAGASPVWDPRPAPQPGYLIAFVHDPDGNLVELTGPER